MQQNIFGYSVNRLDPFTGQALDSLNIHRHTQAALAHVDSLDPSAEEMGPQAAADGFNFGEFRHGSESR
jgi:hypothetical protein